jgi:hypothetical protein
MYNVHRIKQIRKYLDSDSCKTLVSSLVMSHLDYANSIFYGLPNITVKKLQRVQNAAAKLILNKSYMDSSTECLKQLHWLPIWIRIEYKLILLVFKCLSGKAPAYLSDLLIPTPQGAYGLRSSTQSKLLIVPYTSKITFAARSFSVAGPKLWNALP